MAKKTDATTDGAKDQAGDDPPPKRKRRLRLLLIVLLLAVATGGYVVTSSRGDAVAADAPPEPQEPVPGEVVALSPFTLNLADGRFLKVGLALQLVEGVTPPADSEVQGWAAPALDEAISMLGSRTYAELVQPGGRDAAKAELATRLSQRYDGEVIGVYFTELIMQ